MHPLLRYDPNILKGGVQLIKLEYFENPDTKAPVPRNQEVPKEAFGELTGRSILVATSHAWFHQCHPDPQGVKLDILRKDFFPRLRKRYPYTQILVFDDWHSCPQWPLRTKEENDLSGLILSLRISISRFNAIGEDTSLFCPKSYVLYLYLRASVLAPCLFKFI